MLPEEFKGPFARFNFVFAFETEPQPEGESALQEYHGADRWLCGFLSLLFGKRFDAHGLVESSGYYSTPDHSQIPAFCNPTVPWNSSKPRANFPIQLNLVELRRLEPLLARPQIDDNLHRSFEAACRFYLQAVQAAESDAEVAYLHLITAGEILSNRQEYEVEDLIPDDILAALEKLSEVPDGGQAAASQLRQQLRQVRRRFVRTYCDLVDEAFFGKSESRDEYFTFKQESFKKSISAAYDLRSRYVHTGVHFGRWVNVGAPAWDVQVGEPVIDHDPSLGKLIAQAPTLAGLERVTRYCLLRFAASKELIDLEDLSTDAASSQTS